ncbi:MAG: aminotransferase class V-fold PLP-dependent enzyme, partial [Archangium sp.]|nr:aminotransferase class V-fold PLP-dependent enzyme [Archangium sp.]
MSIPLVDLKAAHEAISAEVDEGFRRVLGATAFILGPDVKAFEAEYAAFVGAAHCVGVANGTDAVELCVRAAGLTRDDEVLVPTNSFIATALGVERAGAKVVLVDSDEHHLIDLASCAKRVTKKTKAIFPVHLFGQCAEMEKVSAFAKSHGLVVLEDAAQAQG